MGILFTRFLAVVFLIAAPTYACAHVEINVDLASQTMTVHSGSGETYVWPISSGKAGHATPDGVFRPRAMYAMVHSAKYNNAPMPHSIFFYGQYAIHGTNAVGSLGRPASHGCVRISPANAAALFAMVQSRGRKSALSDRPSAISRAASGIPDRCLDLRPSATRGRSKNGRIIPSHCEEPRGPLTHGLITGNPCRNRADGCRVFSPFRISGHRRFELAGAG
jgi:L,D-transpeptidase catalytic domain